MNRYFWEVLDRDRITTVVILKVSRFSSAPRHAFRPPSTDGYHTAYIDAKDNIIPVLLQVAVIVKARMRSKYVRWVLNRFIDPSNWSLKCEILDALLEHSSFLPLYVVSLPSSQLVGEIDKLILDVISLIDTVYKSLRAEENFINF